MKLYKYSTIGDNSISVLLDRYVWFGKPSALNDPFDCGLIENQFVYQRAIGNRGILSLSATHTNSIMWSHYAGSHTGMCIAEINGISEAHGRASLIPLISIVEIAAEVLADNVVPEKALDDAFHIACDGVHSVDFLLTWNCKHIANPHNRYRIQKCFDRHQIRMPVICTPEEFIGDTYGYDNSTER